MEFKKMKNQIDLEIKKRCVEMAAAGMTSGQIYREYFSKVHEGMCQESFRCKLKQWKKKNYADAETLAAGTYAGFTAHGATVQVDRNGNLIQLWVKQHAEDNQWQELLEVIKETVKPAEVERKKEPAFDRMLEIPLFDMHLPLTDYSDIQEELLAIISQIHREEINIIIGQDLFHNDDFRGRISSGREIEKVDIAKAWRMARDFWYPVIGEAIDNADNVNVIYSKGNHDESFAWAFVKELEVRFPQANFDTTLNQRKCISWKKCFIGITHGAYKRSNDNDLRGQFTIQFPMEFAEAKVREIHTGHLHHEVAGDNYGVMVRRLATANPADGWSSDEGFIGAHRRFQLFEYAPAKLKTIYYL